MADRRRIRRVATQDSWAAGVTVSKPYSRSFSCKKCGKSFVIHSTEFAQGVIQARDYCSSDCRREAKKKSHARDAQCQRCGKPFVAYWPSTKWCSTACGQANHQETHNHRAVKRRRDEKYGLRPGQYDAMVAFQNNKCAICRRPESAKRAGKVKNLSLDHCHATGKVRACLCTKCNLTLGQLLDNIGIIDNFIEYLVFHGMQNIEAPRSIGYTAPVPLLYNPDQLT